MSDDALSRREFIRGATGAAAIVGATGTAAAQEQTGTATGTGTGTATGTSGGTQTGTAGTGTGTADGTDAGTGTAEGTGTDTGTGEQTGTGNGTGEGTGTGGGGGGGGGGGTEEVIVGPGGNLTFEPADLSITPGTTVHFVWESDDHNIVVENQPDDANWEGTEGGESQTYDTGHEYSFTFDVLGTYDYYCQPHLSAGMEASVEVVESLDSGGGEDVPSVPDSAKTLGVATTFAMMATLTLAFFFLKYGGDSGYDEE